MISKGKEIMMAKLIMNILLVSTMGCGSLMTMDQGATSGLSPSMKLAMELSFEVEDMKEELKNTPKGSEKYQDLTDSIKQRKQQMKAIIWDISYNTPAKL
jgi:hypothetical protein